MKVSEFESRSQISDGINNADEPWTSAPAHVTSSDKMVTWMATHRRASIKQ